jgi:phosphoserine phosphatase
LTINSVGSDDIVRHVLNIIGERADGALYTTYLPDNGPGVLLAKTRAIELSFDGDPVKALTEARRCNAERSFDINVMPAEGRRKKLLVADMDSTIINCECLDELADMAGLKDKVSAITERAMRGEIEFAGALRERVGLLKGLPLEALDRVWRERVRLNPGAKELVATMKAQGAYTLLVSGGFTFFTARVAEAAGFDEHQSNVLIDDGKVLTGEVREPILGREAKLAALESAVAKLGIAHDDVLAVGDGANDLAMIQRAGLGVAYHAKPVVAAAAGASIAHNDLRALLYLQGYRDSEIKSA